ncbi:Surfeit locus protein 1-like protein [Dinothrombium tinctorium]|uniref:SURF1-like protein n=1 Tax=Dinothrombium tinctorium TaxID=1965070 RepID=A0A3S3PGX8_9ACAR|nr:Surfeit locus protein 1-like protein [Dinothrombium tinctorium]RWS13315.1 Surfeit locus protein 1-like protein [Dinothrombium tinctorium]RWS15030.1 Surfeit locus protein 1-like protein [Dinothrombium tinctorium]RWS15034.1 Surfeit locus protein 1-like protein [Dinothrombium tinctorium]
MSTQNTTVLKAPKLRYEKPGNYWLLIFPVTAFGLGTWQVKRRTWKLNLIKQLEDNLYLPPVDLPENLSEVQNMSYRKVKVKGKFDHSQEVYIGPRNLITKNEKKEGGLISSFSKATNGYFVVTPFELSDGRGKILINRGWVPRRKLDPKTREAGQVNDEVTIIGVVRESEKRPPFGLKNEPAVKQFHHRDIEQIAELLGTLPIFLDADENSTVKGGPIGGQTKVSLRNEHMNYIITWWV